jgi:malate dehydrogenase (oxaloacetate-decarboxylating)
MDLMEASLQKHKEWQGKIEVVSRVPIDSRETLSLAYTPGVARPCLEIAEHPEKSFELTRRGGLVAVITDGSAVLGLGDIGPVASMPVMEGKCALFKEFAGVDAFPICVDSKDVDEFVNTVRLIAGSFGGINLEDISAPRCFEIERKLQAVLDIPVFHDDQHGTAIVVSAAAMNACKLTGKKLSEIEIVINGAGAAGCAIAERFIESGAGNVILVDIGGIIVSDETYENAAHERLKHLTNKNKKRGNLADAMKNADMFVGVSRPNLVTEEMIRSMNSKAAVFAMANPTPEIMPEAAKAAGAFIVGTGRSDYPNQINNVLAFPGIFKGALSVRAKAITPDMMTAAAKAIADYVKPDELSCDNILPNPLDRGIAEAVAAAVAAAGGAAPAGVSRDSVF